MLGREGKFSNTPRRSGVGTFEANITASSSAALNTGTTLFLVVVSSSFFRWRRSVLAYKDKSMETAGTYSNAASALTSSSFSRNASRYARVSSQSTFETETACGDNNDDELLPRF